MKPDNNILAELNVNYDDLYERFDGDVDLMIIFLKRLPADNSFSMLKKAVADKDYDAMLMYAHKLKGLCANLGLEYLSSLNDKVVKNIRNNVPFSPDDAFKDIEKEYLRAVDLIGKF